MKFSALCRSMFVPWKQLSSCFTLRARPILTYRYVESIQTHFWRHLVFIPIQAIRSISGSINSKEHQFNRNNSNDFDRVSCVCLLAKLLHCSVDEASELVEQNLKLVKSSYQTLGDSISVLSDNGINPSNVKFNIWLLGFDQDELKCRINLLKRWKFKRLDNGLSLLKLPLSSLARFTLQAEKEMKVNKGLNRITYLASNILCEEKQTCDVFVKYSFMLKMNMETMKELLKITKAHEISGKDLLNDAWLFNYSLGFISARSKLLDQIGAKEKCQVIKPWMLRCKETILNRCFELKEDNIAALGSYSDLVDLMKHELNLSQEEVEDMFLKHPALTGISYSKVKDMIEFLKDLGFSSRQIYLTPRVLCHKQATLSARLAELKKINPELINLHNLCKNRKDYVAFLNKVA